MSNFGVVATDCVAVMPKEIKLLREIRKDPLHTPELAALGVVQMLAPYVQAQAVNIAQKHPGEQLEGLVDRLTKRYRRMAWRDGAITGTSFFMGMPGAMASIYFHQIVMVLEIGTLYGFSPSEGQRICEYLYFQGRHKSVGLAALEIVKIMDPQSHATKKSTGLLRSAWSGLRQVPSMLGIKISGFREKSFADKVLSVLEVLSYVVPVIGVPIWAFSSARATKKLSESAHQYYRQASSKQLKLLVPTVKPPTRKFRSLVRAIFILAAFLLAIEGLRSAPFHHHHPGKFLLILLGEYLLIATYGRVLLITRRKFVS